MKMNKTERAIEDELRIFARFLGIDDLSEYGEKAVKIHAKKIIRTIG